MTTHHKENRFYRISSPKVTKQTTNSNNKPWGVGRKENLTRVTTMYYLKLQFSRKKYDKCKTNKQKQPTRMYGPCTGEKVINKNYPQENPDIRQRL